MGFGNFPDGSIHATPAERESSVLLPSSAFIGQLNDALNDSGLWFVLALNSLLND